ncbi:MAG TPA: hypothetical protein P5515_00805 [Methanolinea sp.]|nr:hypothetical protein [Methanolinea sp.]
MEKNSGYAVYLSITALLAGLIFLGGCVQPGITSPGNTTPVPATLTPGVTHPGGNQFLGTWQHFGIIGTNRVAIRFDFLSNGTGRFDLVAPDLDPPFRKTMVFSWESEGDRLWLGSSNEKQHLDIRHDAGTDRLKVTADNESGLFIGEDFVPGPFYWEFTRAEEQS